MIVKRKNKVLETLSKVGFSKLESIIYLKVLDMESCTTSELSNILEKPRTTVYRHVEKLVKKGFLTQHIEETTRPLTAASPELLKVILQEKETHLRDDLQKVKKLQDSINPIIKAVKTNIGKNKKTAIDVKYYEGKAGASHIYREAFQAEELFSYVNLAKVHKTFPENTSLYLKHHSTGTIVKEIIAQNDESIKKAELFTRKSKGFDYRISDHLANRQDIDILIYNKKVAIIHYNADRIITNVLENLDYYYHTKNMFEFSWTQLQKG